MFAMQQFSGILPLKRAASFANAKSLTMSGQGSNFLLRTQGTGNRRLMTFSFWIYPVSSDNFSYISSGGDSANDLIYYSHGSSNLVISLAGGASGNANSSTLSSSVWAHCLVQIDTANATAGNRVKIYINGSNDTTISTTVTQNYDTGWGANTQSEQNINGLSSTGTPYIDELARIDGTLLSASSFASAGKPIDLSGLTFGSQGYWLRFETGVAATVGNDSSPNGNNFTNFNNNFVNGDFSSSVP